jgi:hypothetical protein
VLQATATAVASDGTPLQAFWVWLSNGRCFQSPYIAINAHGGSFRSGEAHFADVNGDGKADLLFQANLNEIYLSLAGHDLFLA